MAYIYEDLKQKPLSHFRDISTHTEHKDVQEGYAHLNKNHLIAALCQTFTVDTRKHYHIAGIDKTSIKTKTNLSNKSARKHSKHTLIKNLKPCAAVAYIA